MKYTAVLILIALLLAAGNAGAQDSLNVRQVGLLNEDWDMALDITIVDTIAFVATRYTGLYLLNIANPNQPVEIGHITADLAVSVTVDDIYAFVADWNGLRIIDIANPEFPLEISFFDSPGIAFDVTVDDSYAYLADWHRGLRVIDISNPASPYEVGSTVFSRAEYIVTSENKAYVGRDGDGVEVIDLEDQTNPISIAHQSSYSTVVDDLCIVGNNLYVLCGHESDLFHYGVIRVYDVSDPSEMLELGEIPLNTFSRRIVIVDDMVYVTNHVGLRLINIGDPSTPLVGFYNISSDAGVVAVSGSYAFVAQSSCLSVYDCSAALGIGDSVPSAIPQTVTLHPCYPNPFNPTATIGFELPVTSEVSLTVYNALGQEVETLVNGQILPGMHTVTFDGSRFSSGSYFYSLKAGEFTETRKMVLIK